MLVTRPDQDIDVQFSNNEEVNREGNAKNDKDESNKINVDENMRADTESE